MFKTEETEEQKRKRIFSKKSAEIVLKQEPGIPPTPSASPPPPSPTPTPTITPSITPTMTITPTVTGTITPTPTMTNTPSPTPYGPPLIFVVETNTINQQINLGFMGEGTYSGIIDWGDGNILPMTNDISGIKTYSSAGIYEIKVYGTIIGLEIGALSSNQRVRFKEVKQWGTLQAVSNSFNSMFGNCTNLVLTGVTDVLNLQGVTSTTFMFGSLNSDNNSITTINRIGEWDMSSVVNMSGMFSRVNGFISNITSWNVSAATNMSNMFNGVDAFNQNISGWDVSNVTNMNSMFSNAVSFNQDLSSWCVSLIPSIPTGFDSGVPGWVLPRPVWGTCP